MIIIAAIRKFLRLDNEVISLDNELINSAGLMLEASKDFMPPPPSSGCYLLSDHLPNFKGDNLPASHLLATDIG
jgi:hypothetical protein